jgi:hypothetical protein
MRRIDNKHIEKWSEEQKQSAISFLNSAKENIETFINAALESLGQSTTQITSSNGSQQSTNS